MESGKAIGPLNKPPITASFGADGILRQLKSQANPSNVAGMARFGISAKNTLGVPVPFLRKIARQTGKNHALALQLWASGIHEARILASMVGEPSLVTEKQMDSWAEAFDSWDVCDQACMNLFCRHPSAYRKALEWSERGEEFVRRAGFALMASLAVHDKSANDGKFGPFFEAIVARSGDGRNFVKKAVNWALRQIGKRNSSLNRRAITVARQIQRAHPGSKAAKWVAAGALRELQDPKTLGRIKLKRLKPAKGLKSLF